MKIEYKANFSGYITLLRATQLLMREYSLSFADFGAYICFVLEADWFKGHKTYKVLIRGDNELAREWGCNLSTVSRRRRNLIEKGLLKEKDGLTVIESLPMFEKEWANKLAKCPHTFLQSFFAKSGLEIEIMLESLAKTHGDLPQNSPQISNIPSKVELDVLDGSKLADEVLAGMEKDKNDAKFQ